MPLIRVRLSPPPSPRVLVLLASPKAPIPFQGPFPSRSRLTLSQLILWDALQSSFLVLEAAASTPPMGRCLQPSAPHPRVRGLGAHPWPCAEPAPEHWRWQCHPGVPWGDQGHPEVTRHPEQAELRFGMEPQGAGMIPDPIPAPLLCFTPTWGWHRQAPVPHPVLGPLFCDWAQLCSQCAQSRGWGCTGGCGAAPRLQEQLVPPAGLPGLAEPPWPAWALVSLKQQHGDILR